MLIEQSWTPGVWIDGKLSHDPAGADTFGTFAHNVHENLIAARSAGIIPADSAITTSATTVRPFWGDAPDLWFLHIRLTGLSTVDVAARDVIAGEARAVLDRCGAAQLSPAEVGRYSCSLFFVDDDDRPRDTRSHRLRLPSAP